nr:hypothetical protein CFP56_21647 [Quercus suber]
MLFFPGLIVPDSRCCRRLQTSPSMSLSRTWCARSGIGAIVSQKICSDEVSRSHGCAKSCRAPSTVMNEAMVRNHGRHDGLPRASS